MNLHTLPRTFYLTRHGQSEYNLLGKIGGDSGLTPAGFEYARRLALFAKEYIGQEIKEDIVTGEETKTPRPGRLWTSTLRRTKETRAEDMNLPPRIVTIRTVRLHPIEEDFYKALYSQTRASFDDYVAEGTLLNNYAHIFVGQLCVQRCCANTKALLNSLSALFCFYQDLLTKMRQAVGSVVFSAD